MKIGDEVKVDYRGKTIKGKIVKVDRRSKVVKVLVPIGECTITRLMEDVKIIEE